jgi:hypothetical protein
MAGTVIKDKEGRLVGFVCGRGQKVNPTNTPEVKEVLDDLITRIEERRRQATGKDTEPK